MCKRTRQSALAAYAAPAIQCVGGKRCLFAKGHLWRFPPWEPFFIALKKISHRPAILPKERRAFLRLLAVFRFASFEPEVRDRAQISVAPQCVRMSRTFL